MIDALWFHSAHFEAETLKDTAAWR